MKTLKFFLILLVPIFILLGISFQLPLLSYQEARRAVIIQETFLSQSLIPMFNGEPYFTKPPLHTWISLPFYAIGLLIHQEIPALRLLSFLCYFGIIFLIYLLSQKNPFKTLLTTFILFSFHRFLSFIYRIDLEPLFVFCFLLSFYTLLKFAENPSHKRGLLFYLFFALAFMVRGPLHFFLFLSIFIYAFLFKNKTFLKILFYPPGWLLFLVITVPFYLYGYFTFGEKVFHEFLKTDLSSRLFAEKDPFYYYFKAFLLNTFPFLFLLLLKIKTLTRNYLFFLQSYPLNLYFSIFFFSLVFLSFTGEKFDKYLLFIYPLSALFFSEILIKLYEERFLLKISTLFYLINCSAVLITLTISYPDIKKTIILWKNTLDPKRSYFFQKEIHPLFLYLLKRPIPLLTEVKEKKGIYQETHQKKEKILISSEIIKNKNLKWVLQDPYKKGKFWYLYEIE